MDERLETRHTNIQHLKRYLHKQHGQHRLFTLPQPKRVELVVAGPPHPFHVVPMPNHLVDEGASGAVEERAGNEWVRLGDGEGLEVDVPFVEPRVPLVRFQLPHLTEKV